MGNPSTGVGDTCDHTRIMGVYWVRYPHKYWGYKPIVTKSHYNYIKI